MDSDCTQVQAFLTSHFDRASSHIVRIGAGAWSQCFGFRRGDQELVIRFGQHVDDFRKDQLASTYRSPDLPIPAVLAIGPAFDGYYAISTRAHGRQHRLADGDQRNHTDEDSPCRRHL